MIVMKFGGSSLRDGPAMKRALGAVAQRSSRRSAVVLSAAGKSTDQLLQVARSAGVGALDEASSTLRQLKHRHLELAADLLVGAPLGETAQGIDRMFDSLDQEVEAIVRASCCRPRDLDAVASFGERLSTLIFAQALRQCPLPVVLLDSTILFRTDARATEASVIIDETYALLRKEIGAQPPGTIPVLQGFIASGPGGEVTTIGRGGSDLTACLLGAAIGAEEIQIWTDVPGIMTADPRLVPRAFKIKALSFREAAELAYFGAKVLHPAALEPAMEADVPVYVLDSSRTDLPGTRVTRQEVPSLTPVKAVACKEGIAIINIQSPQMLMRHGFARRIFEVFDRHRVSVDVIATSEVNVSVTVDRLNRLQEVLEELSRLGRVDIQHNMAVVSVVGQALDVVPGLPARVFRAVREIEVRLISLGASQSNLTFLVAQENMRRAVTKIHAEFFARPDPQVFEFCAAEAEVR